MLVAGYTLESRLTKKSLDAPSVQAERRTRTEVNHSAAAIPPQRVLERIEIYRVASSARLEVDRPFFAVKPEIQDRKIGVVLLDPFAEVVLEFIANDHIAMDVPHLSHVARAQEFEKWSDGRRLLIPPPPIALKAKDPTPQLNQNATAAESGTLPRPSQEVWRQAVEAAPA